MVGISVYVETSVWSFAFAEDVPNYRQDTLAFFECCRRRVIEPVISPVVLAEIGKAPHPLGRRLADLLREIAPTVVGVSDEAERLAGAFLRESVVPRTKPEDARHVAVAFCEGLDVLVSWNFRHIASVRRADRFNAVAVLEGFYKPLRIVSPPEVTYDNETETD